MDERPIVITDRMMSTEPIIIREITPAVLRLVAAIRRLRPATKSVIDLKETHDAD